MNAKLPFTDYIPAKHACSELQRCRDEIAREIATRKRIYDKWIAEGRSTWTECDDRMRQLMGALLFIDQHVPDDAKIMLELKDKPF